MLWMRTASSSETVTRAEAPTAPVAEALTVTVSSPSTTLLSIALTAKVAVALPAWMVTVDGTVTRLVSLLVSVTVSALPVSPLRETVPVAAFAPAFSEKAEGVMLRPRVSWVEDEATGAKATPRNDSFVGAVARTVGVPLIVLL
jgi:hypothetical protein